MLCPFLERACAMRAGPDRVDGDHRGSDGREADAHARAILPPAAAARLRYYCECAHAQARCAHSDAHCTRPRILSCQHCHTLAHSHSRKSKLFNSLRVCFVHAFQSCVRGAVTLRVVGTGDGGRRLPRRGLCRDGAAHDGRRDGGDHGRDARGRLRLRHVQGREQGARHPGRAARVEDGRQVRLQRKCGDKVAVKLRTLRRARVPVVSSAPVAAAAAAAHAGASSFSPVPQRRAQQQACAASAPATGRQRPVLPRGDYFFFAPLPLPLPCVRPPRHERTRTRSTQRVQRKNHPTFLGLTAVLRYACPR